MVDVSFILAAYNNETYIRAAIQGALAQDFEPLEVIISDDCSTDRTFTIMEEEVKRYRGPHQVRLNRNKTNLGEGEHCQKLAFMTQGKFLITAHGDDISMPSRTRRLVETWQKQECSLIGSNAIIIDQKGTELGVMNGTGDSRITDAKEIISGWDETRLGAALAQEKELYTIFPEITWARFPMGIDNILPFRGSLRKGAYYLNEPLFFYRRHEHNLGRRLVDNTQDSIIRKEGYMAIRIALNMCMLEDLNHLRLTNGDSDKFREIEVEVKEKNIATCKALSKVRNELYHLGKRPTWIDSDVMDARPLTPYYLKGAKKTPPELSLSMFLYNRLRSTSLWRVARLLLPNRNKY